MTWSQVRVYLDNSGFVMLLRDMPMLQYHFSQLSDDQCTKMVSETGKVNPIRAQAWKAFTARYGPQDQKTGVSREAAQDFLKAVQAGRVPKWAIAIAPTNDIAAAR